LLRSGGFATIRRMKLLAVFASLVVAAACGSKAPATTTTTGDTGAATAVLPDVPFEKLDHDQQIQFMKEVVVPKMAPLFQAHDAKEFADFGCKTCHGPGAEKGEFEMPNPGLPKLNFKDMSKHKPEDLEWMGKVIKPEMAKLLGEPEYSESTPDGFGCVHCHTAEAQ
jgi:hypothetical protein